MSDYQSIRVRDEWFSRAKYPDRIEHCLGFEKNDNGIRSAYGIPNISNQGQSKDKKTKYITTESLATSSAVRNWNGAAQMSTGEFILLIADDLVPNFEWDFKIENFIASNGFRDGVFKFTDDRCSSLVNLHNDTLLPRHPGMLRNTYEKLGYFFDPIFDSTGPDNDLLIFALSNGILRDARSIKFHHSIGPVMDLNSNVICDCSASYQFIPTRTISQKRIHSQKSVVGNNLLRKKWRTDYYLMMRVACINRLSDFVMNSMKSNNKNQPISIVIKSFFRYFTKNYLHSIFNSKGSFSSK
jgi:hypothetical protein